MKPEHYNTIPRTLILDKLPDYIRWQVKGALNQLDNARHELEKNGRETDLIDDDEKRLLDECREVIWKLDNVKKLADQASRIYKSKAS